MIVHPRVSWLRLLFTFRGSSLRRDWYRIAAATLLSVVVSWVGMRYDLKSWSLTVTPFTVIGLALSIFLGFRNNACYDRFWEGRKLWGQLVNVSRSLTRQLLTLTVSGSAESTQEEYQKQTVLRLAGYVYSLKHHLRTTDPTGDLQNRFSEAELQTVHDQHNIPLALLQIIARRIERTWKDGGLNDWNMQSVEGSLTEITAIQGGCERILNTPVPFTYTVLIHRVVAFYCFALPFGIWDTVGALSPLVVFLISHAFFGLDVIGDEIEDPFGTDINDLPLDTITRTIEINLLDLLDEPNVPDLPEPVDGVLY
ncbi:MAG: bestrophin family ion channel [Planctomycetota bacterium]|nr:bestrophin family ion channel [Planctomycetota bacterium]MDA1247868.1 bestrophin family ion channel [Planctomycetota bacterium]